MSSAASTKALLRLGALVPAGRPALPADDLSRLEARLLEVLSEVTSLDLEIEALSQALSEFERAWERRLGPFFSQKGVAEKLVSRLLRLEDGLLLLAEELETSSLGAPWRGARKGKGRRRRVRPFRRAEDFPEEGPAVFEERAPGEEAPSQEEPVLVESAEVLLKRVYRRLARLLHPDLGRSEEERRRLSDEMARVNAAYARGDLTELTVLAERLGAGEPLDELTVEERRAHLETRIATLERIASSLGAERSRLVASDTFRLRAEGALRAEAGKDLFQETEKELLLETEAAYADALQRLARLRRAAEALARARKVRMGQMERRGPTGARRAFDPLAESLLVRQGAARLMEKGLTSQARELARALEDRVREEPWEVALTLLAFFAEAAGGRPPESLSTAEGMGALYEELRQDFPKAPDFSRALGRLPRHLSLGARAQGADVLAGVQLASSDLVSGVALALSRPSLRELSSRVLTLLGPRERCQSCRKVGPLLHLYRTRGLDTLHGQVCARCGKVLRSYWRYGEVDGLEALSPYARRLAIVSEVTVSLGETVIGFEMLPEEAEALSADRLRRRFFELYLVPYEVALPPESLVVKEKGEPLRPSVRVLGRGALEIAPARDMTGPELLELLRVRIERRFKP